MNRRGCVALVLLISPVLATLFRILFYFSFFPFFQGFVLYVKHRGKLMYIVEWAGKRRTMSYCPFDTIVLTTRLYTRFFLIVFI